MRIYHPAYERKRDRVTGVDFLPAELGGKKLATAEVTDPDHVRSLLARGFLPWPGQTPPEGALAAPSGSAEASGEPEAQADGAEAQADAQAAPAAEVDPPEAPRAPGGPEAHLPTAEELDAMTVAELREVASTLGIELPAKGTKAELRALILAPF